MTQFKVVDNKKFDDYQIEILIQQAYVDPSKLKFNKSYQRLIEEPRWLPIFKSINEYGYWPFSIIIANENWEVVDGQHRVVGALEANVDSVPVCKVRFPSKKLEAKFFTDINNYNTKLKPIDFWAAKKIAQDPIAILLYQLESDSKSFFYNNIAIKGKETSTKLSVSDALIFITSIVLDYPTHYENKLHEKLLKAINSKSYSEILLKTNKILGFIEATWGNKKNNPFVYRKKSIRAIVVFYFLLKERGKHNNNATIQKMKSFSFNNEFMKLEHISKVMALVNHYNHKRKKEKIIYAV